MSTSLPWVVLARAHIVDLNAWTIAQCYGDDAEDNARLIVTAVNSHAGLIAAAKAVSGTFMSISSKPHPQHDVLLAMDEAIAKAEEL